MTTFNDILAFVKSKARIATADTTRDADIGLSINAAYRRVCASDFFPFLRIAATTVLVAGTQEYDLPADFGQMDADSVRVYETNTTNYQYLTQAIPPDAALWDNMQSTYCPGAWRIVAGSTNLVRAIRIMPLFTGISYTLGYAYYKRIADVSGTAVLGDPLICDAVAWYSLAQNEDWNRDPDVTQRNYDGLFKQALRDARSNLYS